MGFSFLAVDENFFFCDMSLKHNMEASYAGNMIHPKIEEKNLVGSQNKASGANVNLFDARTVNIGWHVDGQVKFLLRLFT